MTTPSISTELARFAGALDYGNIPAEVMDNAKLRLLDTVGVCLASIGMPYANAILAHVEDQGGREDARLFATSVRLPVPLAVLYNASLAHGNDYDDTHSRSIVHVGGVVVPTALAVAEKKSRSGKQTLAAIVTGYEIATRVGMVASKGFHSQGFHPTGVCGAFGAAATAAKLLGLDEGQFAHAMGIAGSQASGSLEFLADGAWTKRLHPGWSAHAGVSAAGLAEQGFTGPRHTFEGRYGLYALYATATPPDLGLATAGLMQEWEILNTDFKPYPCGHISHPYMDCALQLREQHSLAPMNIESIELRVPAAAVPILCEPLEDKRRPQTGYAARFSLPFSTALIFAYGKAEIDDFSDERLVDPVIRELSDRTTYVIDDSLPFPETFPGWVVVRLKSGARLESRMDASRGSREHPMSDTEIFRKFEANASRVLPPDRVQGLWAAGRQLERFDDIKHFCDLLAA